MHAQTSILKLFRAGLFLALPFPSLCHSYEDHASDSQNISADAFKSCSFQFNDTPHLAGPKKANSYSGSYLEGSCSYDLSIKGFHTLGDQFFWLFIVDNIGTKIDQTIDYSGFKKKNGDWSFIGHSFSIGKLIKYQKLSFKVIDNDRDTTLVGRQIERGTDQTGTPMTFEAVHILRISPNYAISVDMPFDQGTPLSTRDEVVKELTQLVNSVHSVPDVSTTSAPSENH